MKSLLLLSLILCGSPLPDGQNAAVDSGSLARRRSPVVEVVERAGPAVVNVASEIEERPNPFRRRMGGDEFFRQFFGERPQEKRQSLGSGVIVDPEGLIITNEHVVSRASNVTVTLADRRTFEVDVVGADPNFDLAILKVRGGKVKLPTVDLGSSSDLMPGETVVAIGNPFGLANTVTTGVVSALHRSIVAEDRAYEDFIQTDAAINPGNSGGALLNIEGKLIGINTAIYGGGTGIGFAIPVDKARAAFEEVRRYGEVRPAFSGLIVDPASTRGAGVRAVNEASPAKEAGIKPGDRIIDASGQEMRTGRDWLLYERSMVPRQNVRLTVMRGDGQRGHEQKLLVDLLPKELSPDHAAEMGRERLALEVSNGPRALVIQKVKPGSNAAEVGIRRGDLLLMIGGRRLSTIEEFNAVCAAIRDSDAVAVVIGRNGRAYYVTLRL
jgi:serine protease Do